MEDKISIAKQRKAAVGKAVAKLNNRLRFQFGNESEFRGEACEIATSKED